METGRTTVGTRFRDIVAGRRSGEALGAVWNTAPLLNSLAEVDLKTYYYDAEVKLKAQLDFVDRFPSLMCLPGIWADFGALLEPSAFGCDIGWPKGGMPMARPVIKSPLEIDALRPPDPQRDGLMPLALDQCRYFQDNLEQDYRDQYGFVDGVAASFGPVELAAVLMGHANFFTALLSWPEALKQLLEMTTEAVIGWLEAMEKVNGPLKFIALADHIPGQISKPLFQEFWKPYTGLVTARWPEAIVLYHNEFPVPYPGELTGLGFDIFHFGGPLAPLRRALGDSMTLMGNLDPVELMINGSRNDIGSAAADCLALGLADNGRFLLSTGGGLAPETPPRSIAALAGAVDHWELSRKNTISTGNCGPK